jgi:F-box protein 21
VASERAEALDKTGPKIKRRELDGKQVQYKVSRRKKPVASTELKGRCAQVGQVFHHRHYGYLGVINGHDPVCTASMEWQRAMRLEELPHGAEQPFYNVMVDDGSTRYVAEENIEVCAEVDSVQVQTLVSLQPYLGRYFASFDWETQQFVPSADTALQYPDG